MVIEENVFFQASDAMIEGVLTYDDSITGGPGVVLCSPHPQLGGDMENNIILSLHRFSAEEKFISLRFNYRGVGNSSGQESPEKGKEDLKVFWEHSWSPMDAQRPEDVMAALKFLQGVPGVVPDSIFLVGYSFGAWAAQHAVIKKAKVKALVLIAPTIHFHDYSPLAHMDVPKLVVTSDNDFSYTIEELQNVYGGFSTPKLLKIFSGADHFFIGREEELSSHVVEFMLTLCGKRTRGA